MAEKDQREDEVFHFIFEEIDSVSQLEGMLLLWQNRPHPWTVADLAKRLYVSPDLARGILLDLARKQLIAIIPGQPDSYFYESRSEEKDQLIARVDETYRREIIRISTLIHSKPSSAVRDFARAFRFTKEKD